MIQSLRFYAQDVLLELNLVKAHDIRKIKSLLESLGIKFTSFDFGQNNS